MYILMMDQWWWKWNAWRALRISYEFDEKSEDVKKIKMHAVYFIIAIWTCKKTYCYTIKIPLCWNRYNKNNAKNWTFPHNWIVHFRWYNERGHNKPKRQYKKSFFVFSYMHFYVYVLLLLLMLKTELDSSRKLGTSYWMICVCVIE